MRMMMLAVGIFWIIAALGAPLAWAQEAPGTPAAAPTAAQPVPAAPAPVAAETPAPAPVAPKPAAAEAAPAPVPAPAPAAAPTPKAAASAPPKPASTAAETPAPVSPKPVASAPSKPASTAAAKSADSILAGVGKPNGASADGSKLAGERISLMTMFQWGGTVLWVLMAMGFVALVMAIYLLLTVTPKREAPANFTKRVMALIRAGDLRAAYQMCEGRDELLVSVIRAGIKMSGHERYVIQEAMESEGERGAMSLWQKIQYLNNIGVVSPLVGLLGTVWGMVLAFSAIAADNAQVKSMAVASCVSKAMICTVGGLVVAIPSLCVYYYLRGRVVKVIVAVEAQASEVVEALSRGRDR